MTVSLHIRAHQHAYDSLLSESDMDSQSPPTLAAKQFFRHIEELISLHHMILVMLISWSSYQSIRLFDFTPSPQ